MNKPSTFLQSRQMSWQQLDQLLQRAQGGSRHLTPEEIETLGRLYRAAVSDLALAQRDFPQHDVTRYLNQLVGRGHSLLYRGNLFSTRDLRTFFTHTMPQTWRAAWRYVLVAMVLLFGPALLGGVLTASDPARAAVVLPAGLEATVYAIENHEPWFYFEGGDQPAAASFITSNNIRVSVLAFAGGMLAGLLTIYVLVLNGLMLGGLLGLAVYHQFYDLLHFVIGHGVIELSVITFAGASGLMFGWAILHPGPFSRADALRQAGRRALIVLLLSALWLIVAGAIEGFISPVEALDPTVKWSVGLGSGLLMYGYLLLAGRERSPRRRRSRRS